MDSPPRSQQKSPSRGAASSGKTQAAPLALSNTLATPVAPSNQAAYRLRKPQIQALARIPWGVHQPKDLPVARRATVTAPDARRATARLSTRIPIGSRRWVTGRPKASSLAWSRSRERRRPGVVTDYVEAAPVGEGIQVEHFSSRKSIGSARARWRAPSRPNSSAPVIMMPRVPSGRSSAAERTASSPVPLSRAPGLLPGAGFPPQKIAAISAIPAPAAAAEKGSGAPLTRRHPASRIRATTAITTTQIEIRRPAMDWAWALAVSTWATSQVETGPSPRTAMRFASLRKVVPGIRAPIPIFQSQNLRTGVRPRHWTIEGGSR